MNLPLNSCRLLLLSIGFLFQFAAFMTAQGLAASVLEKADLGSMGFYSLALLYLIFSLSCFVATPIVNRCGERLSLSLGSLCYSAYIGSFILVSVPDQFPENKINASLVATLIMIGAAINGFGAAILWVAQGKYISRCAND